jgi:hypothetical protein
MLFRLHYHIVNVCVDISSDLSFQDDMDVLLICSSPVFEVELHFCVIEDSKWGDERCFFFIANAENDLMIA